MSLSATQWSLVFLMIPLIGLSATCSGADEAAGFRGTGSTTAYGFATAATSGLNSTAFTLTQPTEVVPLFTTSTVT